MPVFAEEPAIGVRHPPAAHSGAPADRGGSAIAARNDSLGVALALTVLSAGLYALTFPPVRARWLAWVALVPLLVAIRAASLRRRLGLGLLWTLAVGYGVGTWMPGAVSHYFHQPLAIGIGLFLLVTGAMAAPYYVAFTAAYAPLAVRYGVWGPWLAGAAWAGVELLRGRLLNGTLVYVGNSPWATFGYSQAESIPIIQIASVTGVYGVSFVLVVVNAGVAEIVAGLRHERRVGRRPWHALALALATLGVVLAFGALAIRSADRRPPEAAAVPIAIVQANVAAAVRWDAEGPARTLDAHLRLTRQVFERGRPQIVFWPEVALTFFLERDTLYRQAIAVAFGDLGAELVAGAPRALGPDGAGPYLNSVYLLGPDDEILGRYDKRYLLPFMEYFPLDLELARRRFGRVREFTPGAPTPLLPTRAGAAGVLVCNEAFLPHVAGGQVAAGAAYLVNPSNDSWVPNAGFAWQQFDIVSLRAVEQRRYLVRVSDSGPSGVVDPLGRIVAHTDALAPDVLLASVVPLRARSPYARVGDLFGAGCLLATGLALVGARGGARRRQPGRW